MSNGSKAPKDPFIEAQIESSLRPYLGIAPPALLLAMRESLETALTTHPVAVGLLKQLRDRAAPQKSGDEPREGVDVEDEKSGGQEGT
jgi:hypothetical protein